MVAWCFKRLSVIHIETETRWPTVCRRHFQVHFLEWRYINLHWFFPEFFLRVKLTIFQHWFRWCLGADQATSHHLNQWWYVYRRTYASLGLNEWNNDISGANSMASSPIYKFTKSNKLWERKREGWAFWNLLSPQYQSILPIAFRHLFCYAAIVKFYSTLKILCKSESAT